MPDKSARCIIILEHAIACFAQHIATWDQVCRGGKSPYTIPTVDDHVQHNGSAPQSHDSWYFDIIDDEGALSLDILFERFPGQNASHYMVSLIRKGQPVTTVVDSSAPFAERDEAAQRLKISNYQVEQIREQPLRRFYVKLNGSAGGGYEGYMQPRIRIKWIGWAGEITIGPGSPLLDVC